MRSKICKFALFRSEISNNISLVNPEGGSGGNNNGLDDGMLSKMTRPLRHFMPKYFRYYINCQTKSIKCVKLSPKLHTDGIWVRIGAH